MEIKEEIKNWLCGKVDAVGFAPVDRFGEAPEKHHPEYILPGAKTVIVYGRLIPRSVTKSPNYGKYFLHRSYHTVYPYLDELGYSLASHLEAETGEFAELSAHGISRHGAVGCAVFETRGREGRARCLRPQWTALSSQARRYAPMGWGHYHHRDGRRSLDRQSALPGGLHCLHESLPGEGHTR